MKKDGARLQASNDFFPQKEKTSCNLLARCASKSEMLIGGRHGRGDAFGRFCRTDREFQLSSPKVRKSMSSSKVALVTGSGKHRVGWHVAEALAARGYALAVHYRSSAAEAAETVAAFRARGVEAVALQADLTDEP